MPGLIEFTLTPSTNPLLDRAFVKFRKAAAFLNFTKALSKRGLVDGVNVNSINPGMTSTDRLITIIQNNADREGISFVDAEKNALKNIGLDRFSTPEEVAELAYFLCDPKVRHLTGTEINLDGGKKPTI